MSVARPFDLRCRRVWDYNSNGLYFVTVVTKNKALLFGEMQHAALQWSAAGAVADLLWRQLDGRLKGVSLGAFVVLPNHLHGIICVDHPAPSAVLCTTPLRGFRPKNEEMSHISPSAGSLSVVIRAYKAAVTKQLKQLNIAFAWQRGFHSYPLHSAEAYHRVIQHLQHNHKNWSKDKLHPDYQPTSKRKTSYR